MLRVHCVLDLDLDCRDPKRDPAYSVCTRPQVRGREAQGKTAFGHSIQVLIAFTGMPQAVRGGFQKSCWVGPGG
jgi:hypothetical protein